MAHMFQTGAFVQVPAWHNLGNVLDSAPKTVAEFMIAAGQGWKVNLETIHDSQGKIVPLGKMIRRDDNQEILGVVGPNTHVLQNSEAFEHLQPYVDSGLLQLETAGCLDRGAKVWMLAKINKPNFQVVSGDDIAKYFLVSNSHDGTLSVRIGLTPVRVVCWNTLSSAIFSKDAEKQLVRIRHTRKVQMNVRDAVQAVESINDAMDKGCEGFAALARRSIREGEVREYFKNVFKMEESEGHPLPKQSRDTLDSLMVRYNANREAATELLANFQASQEIAREAQETVGKAVLETLLDKMETGIGTENAASRGTWWTAYNAVTEYLTHERGRTNETRFASLNYGDSAKKNETALKLALTGSGLQSA